MEQQYKTDSEIYAVLEREIIDLTLRPGCSLSENPLCTRFGAPRSLIRVVLQRLQENGLVKIVPYKGTTVTRLNRDIVDELIYERIAVEARVLRDFAPHCTPEHRALIRQRAAAYDELAKAETLDFNRLYEADTRLHETWFSAMGKMYLWRTLQNAHADYSRFRMLDTMTSGGLDEVKQWISGRLCAFCGNSGVGKSTLLNALLPDVERQTAAISQKLGRGRHTTREVTIFEAFGGRIADTPGFASLEASRAGFIPKEALEHAFPEFGPYLGACQFTGCSHRSEKGCAVRAALAEGKLSQTRYDSYCAMYDEVKDVKEWQRRG